MIMTPSNEPIKLLSSDNPIIKPYSLLDKFIEQEYECYDGINIQQDSILHPEDIAASIMINSQISGNTARKIWEDAQETIFKHLTRIDNKINLGANDAEIPWNDIKGAIAAICEINRAKIAVATKILHKKRPRLIPIVDSVIFNYYVQYKKPIRGSKIPDRAIHIIKLFREDYLHVLDRISELSSYCTSINKPLTECRILEILIWVSYEPRGHYGKIINNS